MPQPASPRNVAIGHLMEWARRPEWAARLDDAIAAHVGDVPQEFGYDSVEAMFEALGGAAAHVVFGSAFEDFLTHPDEDSGETIVDEYLRRRGFKESVPGRRYLQALRDSTPSLYEVVESVPGSHLILRDLVRGGPPVRVEERSGSRQLVRWDCLAARIVPENRQWVMGGGIVLLDREDVDELLPDLNDAIKRGESAMTEASDPQDPEERRAIAAEVTLGLWAPEFTQTWLVRSLKRLKLPEIRNTDGDEIVFVTTRWPLPSDPGDLARALDAAGRGLVRDPNEERWTWLSDRPLAPPSAGSGMTIMSKQLDGSGLDRTTLGTLRLEGASLVLETNSEPRAARGRELVEEILGARIGTPIFERKSLAELMAEPRDPSAPSPEADIDPEEKARLLGGFKERYYRDWVDRPVPMLDGRTPRDAARDDSTRPRLIALLKELERREFRLARADGLPMPDYRWLWRELGLSPSTDAI